MNENAFHCNKIRNPCPLYTAVDVLFVKFYVTILYNVTNLIECLCTSYVRSYWFCGITCSTERSADNLYSRNSSQTSRITLRSHTWWKIRKNYTFITLFVIISFWTNSGEKSELSTCGSRKNLRFFD